MMKNETELSRNQSLPAEEPRVEALNEELGRSQQVQNCPANARPEAQCEFLGQAANFRDNFARQAAMAQKGRADQPPTKHNILRPTALSETAAKNKISFMKAPWNLRGRAAHIHGYSEEMRQELLDLMHNGPQSSKKPLKARIEKAQRSGKMPARTYNDVMFCERDIKVKEFAAFYRAQSFLRLYRRHWSGSQKVRNTLSGNRSQARLHR